MQSPSFFVGLQVSNSDSGTKKTCLPPGQNQTPNPTLGITV